MQRQDTDPSLSALPSGPLEGALEAAAALLVRHTDAQWCRVVLDMAHHAADLVADHGEAESATQRQRVTIDWFGVHIGHVELSPPLADPSRARQLLRTMIPILAARRALEQSRRSEARERDFLHGVINGVAQPISVKSETTGRYVTVNQSFADLIGRSREAIRGRTDAELVDSDTAARWAEADADTVSAGESEIEEVLTDADGVRRVFLSSRRTLTLGHERWLVGVRTEITHRRSAEHARAHAERESELKSQFLEMIGHETRTPLNAILGIGELLQSTDLDASQASLVDTLRNSGVSLLELVDDILEFVALQGGELEVQREATDVVALTEEVVEQLVPRARERGLQMWCTVQGDAPEAALCDGPRMRQVLHHLTRNALRFTEEGYVHIDVRRTWSRDGQTGVSLSVRDTGIGLDAVEREALFEPFSQADVSSRRRRGGAGLGLAISQRLTEAMGGTLTLDSAPGLGSVFRVALPAADAPTPQHTPLVGSVALVHPNAPWRYAAARMLRGWGLVVRAADSLERLDAADVILAAPTHADEARERWPHQAVLALGGDPGPDALSWPPLPRALRARIEAALGQAREARPPTDPRSGRLGGVRVLLVEDNAVNRLVAERLLQSLSCDVRSVPGGREAMLMLHGWQPDVILMDLHMPEMDGWETAREIRQAETPVADVPIVAVTASATAAARTRCTEVGMNGFLPKPVSADRIEQTILQVLPAGAHPP